MTAVNKNYLREHQAQIEKIRDGTNWRKSNPISNFAKKALFTIAQAYRAIPYYFSSFAYWAGGHRFEVVQDSLWKYKGIWKGLKELKNFSSQMTWFTQEFNHNDFKMANGKNTDFKCFLNTKNLIVIDGVFRRFSNAMWYTGDIRDKIH